MDYFEQENNQIEKYLSDFTSREGVMLTIAGLFSLLPFSEPNILPLHFLKWVLPFLFAALITYICSSKRINVIPSMNAGITSYHVNILLKKRYIRALRFHRATDTLLVIFFVTFVGSYYMFRFYGSINFDKSIVITLVALFIGAVRYHFSTKLDKDEQITGVYASGGAPTDTPADLFNLEK